jgi:Transcriptional regulators containing a DNA-binding HTH domain and an aminotransferase domain (MocR family) and their eukaryotic orthologs
MAKNKLAGGDHLYLQVAGGLEKMIQDETLKIGDKLPSVRMLSEEYGISMGTAFQAYYYLEGKGLIEARPKSGYYVRFNPRRFPALPAVQEPEQVAHTVSVEDMIAAVYKTLTAGDITNFSVAGPDIEFLPAAKLNKSLVHAFRHSKHSCLYYEDRQGNPELRKQVAKLAFNWGGKISADDVVITAGCMEALAMSLRTVTKPGDTVAIESPTYFGIFQVIQSMGLRVVEVPADPLTGVDLNYLEKAIRSSSLKACVFIPNFNNPLGSCMPDENKKALVDMITRHRIPLIEDDIYGDLYFGDHRPRTCKTFDKEGWVLHCSSVSKSLAPGYRIGWVIPGRFTEELKRVKLMHTLAGTTITQQAMAHFLGIGRYEYHLKKLRSVLHKHHLRYVQGILEYFPEDTKVSRPQGGFVLWLELNKKINAFRLYQEAMKYQVSIAPGRIFSASDMFGHYLRMGYGAPWDDKVERGVKIVGALVKRMS